jgi:antitoxin component YwqK of YwqJK toxin-antitoxin module
MIMMRSSSYPPSSPSWVSIGLLCLLFSPRSVEAAPKKKQTSTIEDKASCEAKNGRWERSPLSEGCMLANQRQGRWIAGPDARNHWIQYYQKGALHGGSVTYHKNCYRAAEGDYRQSKRQATWTFYANTGVKEAEGPFKDGKRAGVWSFYHKQGTRVRKGPFVNDEPHGTFEEWFANGKPWQKVRYKRGMRQGKLELACQKKKGVWHQDFEKREQGCKAKRGAMGFGAGWHENGKLAWRANVRWRRARRALYGLSSHRRGAQKGPLQPGRADWRA